MPSWMIMAVEAPLVLSWLATRPMELTSIAAFGVFHSMGLLLEAPVLMLLPTATQLANGPKSAAAVHRHALVMISVALVVATLTTAVPSLRQWILAAGLGLSGDVLAICSVILPSLILWPAAIGYRRVLQGILLANKQSRAIAHASFFRFAGIAVTLMSGSVAGGLPALWAAAALICGVCCETLYTAWSVWRVGFWRHGQEGEDIPVSFSAFLRLFLPLSTSVMASLALPGCITAIIARSYDPVLSLAIFPVVHGFGFFFRAVGLAMQEVFIVGMKEGAQTRSAVDALHWAFVLILVLLLGIIGLTPLARLIFEHLMHLDAPFAAQAATTFVYAIPYPVLTLALSRERARRITTKTNFLIVPATVLEVALSLAIMSALTFGAYLNAASAAMIGLGLGRFCALVFLAWI
ncbi:hypothetical protein [Breoghania sp.]|uniref:hypothetical protein n=1 Tax=Breoghania sp. TaxID=2065378 RepID=UPI002AA7C2B8|nr:hypothetical protein [Breoghania sp.]